jgi:hypothetical protein
VAARVADVSLAARLAGGRAAFMPRLALEPIGNVGGGCHAGAGHAQASDRGTYGELCDPCHAAVLRIVRGAA